MKPYLRPENEDPITVEEDKPKSYIWRKPPNNPGIIYTILLFVIYLLCYRAMTIPTPQVNESGEPQISAFESPKDARQKLDQICESVLKVYEKICPTKDRAFNMECVVKNAMGPDGQVSDPQEFIAVICARHRFTDSLENL